MAWIWVAWCTNNVRKRLPLHISGNGRVSFLWLPKVAWIEYQATVFLIVGEDKTHDRNFSTCSIAIQTFVVATVQVEFAITVTRKPSIVLVLDCSRGVPAEVSLSMGEATQILRQIKNNSDGDFLIGYLDPGGH